MSNLTTRQTIKVKVNQLDGSLVPQNKAPVVLKNTVQQNPGVGGLGNVVEQDVIGGATLVYNSTTNKYDVKPLSILDLADIAGSPSDNDVLFYNDGIGAFVYGKAPLNVGDVVDVDVTNRANGTVLIYDSASNTYIHGIVPIASANGTVGNISTSNLSIGTGSVVVNSISSFANSTQLGSTSSGSNSEIVTAAAIKTYIDELITATGGGGEGGAINLNGLLDVDIDALANGNVLVFDSSINQWINKSIVGVGDINVSVGTGGNIEISLANNFQVPQGITANVVGANTVDANTISISTLTQNRLVVVGPDGLLTDSANLTWNGNVLSLTGNGSITGQLNVTGSANITNNVVVGNVLDVSNNVLVGNSISIGRTATINGNTSISGRLTVANNIIVSNSATIAGNLSAADTTLNSLVVQTTTRFDGTVTSKDIIPAADITYSLGTPENRFKDLFVGPGSVYVGSVVLSDSDGKMAVSSESDYTNTVTFNANTIFNANLQIASTANILGNLIPTSNTTFNIGSSTNLWNLVYANSFFANTGNISGNLVVEGNLTVRGDTTRINVSTVNIEDPVIRLASNNTTTDAVDIGLYGSYYNGVAVSYTGLVRDASNNGVYVLFDHTRTEPTTTLDYSDQYLRLATLNAYISGGGLYTNATNVVVSGDQDTEVTINANTLTISRPLEVTSGGTGRQALLNNHVLVGSGTSSVNMIAGTNSQILAIVGGTPTFVSSLDAGTF